jgi:hypothetical protein
MNIVQINLNERGKDASAAPLGFISISLPLFSDNFSLFLPRNQLGLCQIRVADPHHFNADPDFHFDADPDPQ